MYHCWLPIRIIWIKEEKTHHPAIRSRPQVCAFFSCSFIVSKQISATESNSVASSIQPISDATNTEQMETKEQTNKAGAQAIEGYLAKCGGCGVMVTCIRLQIETGYVPYGLYSVGLCTVWSCQLHGTEYDTECDSQG